MSLSALIRKYKIAEIPIAGMENMGTIQTEIHEMEEDTYAQC
jgi:hypothetical protein